MIVTENVQNLLIEIKLLKGKGMKLLMLSVGGLIVEKLYSKELGCR